MFRVVRVSIVDLGISSFDIVITMMLAMMITATKI